MRRWRWFTACMLWTCLACAETTLPTVASTNLCADLLALQLAAPTQLLSVSRKSQDAALSPLAIQAQQFSANASSAEEIIALKPDIVLASKRWQSRHRSALFERHGIHVVVVSFPITWEEIFQTTRTVADALQRREAAETLLADVAHRLALLQQRQRPFQVLYLRPNGGSAGKNTYVDTVLASVGAINHAAITDHVGWGRFPLEKLVLQPPDVFLLADFARDTTHTRNDYARHPQLQQLLTQTPHVRLDGNHWGCGNWQLIEAAEAIAAQLDALMPVHTHREVPL